MNKIKTGLSIILVVLIVILQSCSVERELAKDFIKSNKDIPVLLQITDKVILTNEKLKKIKGFDSFNIEKQDSLWNANTLYLDSLNDIKLINTIYNNMEARLINYGFHVYSTDSIHEFINNQKQKYSLKIAQIEVSEDLFLYRDQETFFTNLTYYQDNYLNVINLNCWFEFSDMNKKNEIVFYNTNSISDILNGNFTMNPTDYNVNYNFKITPFKTEDIYQLAIKSAQKDAGLLFDYIMNQYIKDNLPHYYTNPKHFSLDINTGFLYNNEIETFTILDTP